MDTETPVFLEGDRADIVPLEQRHQELLYRLWNDPSVWKHDFGIPPHPLGPDAVESEYDSMTSPEPVTGVVRVDGDPAGVTAITDFDKVSRTAELGVSLASGHRGRQVGTEVATLMTTFGFRQLDLHKLVYKAIACNEAATECIEGLGATREGVHRDEQYVDGERHDVYYYGLLASEWEPESV